jgi:large subunit ribosomal protein L25
VGSSIHASDVALPEGTVLIADPASVVVHVMAQATAEQLEADLAAPEAEGAPTEAAPEGAAEGTVAEPTADGPPAEEQTPGE